MALLFDALGRKVYESGVIYEDIRDAIQAAALANDFELAYEIAERYGCYNVCLYCAEATSTAQFWTRTGNWRVCTACKKKLELEPARTDLLRR